MNIRLLSCLSLCFLAPLVQAEVYVSANINRSVNTYNAQSLNLQSAGFYNRGEGFDFYVGEKLTENWALEGGYARFNRTRVYNINGTSVQGAIDPESFNAGIRAFLPMMNDFVFSARGGIATIHENPDPILENSFHAKNHLGPYFGALVSYRVADRWLIDTSYMHTQNSRNRFNTFGVGTTFTF
jgi:hypothetical protein